MTTIQDNETLFDHINQTGITTGPKKLGIFRKACELRGVPLYKNDGTSHEKALVKLFDPTGSWTWYISEWDGESECFGLVDGWEKEFGYFSLIELSQLKGKLGIGIEVDTYWTPKLLKEVEASLDK
jgi:hypothetical protein